MTREPSPDAAGVSAEAGPPERDRLGNGKCFRLSGDDGTEDVLEQESPGSALYPVPAEQKDKYYLVFRHSGKSLEADPKVPVRMVSESKQTRQAWCTGRIGRCDRGRCRRRTGATTPCWTTDGVEEDRIRRPDGQGGDSGGGRRVPEFRQGIELRTRRG